MTTTIFLNFPHGCASTFLQLTALHSTLNIEHVQESFNKERGQPDELTDPLSIPNEVGFIHKVITIRIWFAKCKP